jgi:biotin synthase
MRTDWTRKEIAAIYHQPLLDLLVQAQEVHRRFHPANEVQMCRLLSIKTGGCPEDCAYCPQSERNDTGVEREPLMNCDEISPAARRAKADGATRFCMAPHGDSLKAPQPDSWCWSRYARWPCWAWKSAARWAC